MGKKILINEDQLILLVNHINENQKTDELLEEGLLKSVILGAALVLGANVGRAQDKAEQILKNNELRDQIKTTLSNEEGIKELASKLKTNPDTLKVYMKKNQEKIKATFDEYEEDTKSGVYVQGKENQTVKGLLDKIKNQGYSITNIETLVDTIVKQPGKPVLMSDTLKLNLGGQGMKSFEHTLSQENVQSVETMLKTIKSIGGVVKSITILSKTDAEPVPSYATSSDPTGNYKLAKLRAEEAVKSIQNSGIDFGGVKINVDSTSQVNSGLKLGSQELKSVQDEFKQDKQGSRDKYSNDRGVEVVIDYEYNSDTNNDKKPEVIINKIVKVSYVKATLYEKVGDSTTGSEKTKTFKTTKPPGCTIKVGGGLTNCPNFNL